VRKCSYYASLRGYNVFALFDGGMCITGPHHVGSMFGLLGLLGASNKCDFRGLGGINAVSVYSFETGKNSDLEKHCDESYKYLRN